MCIRDRSNRGSLISQSYSSASILSISHNLVVLSYRNYRFWLFPCQEPVSYTHLDVYKRQEETYPDAFGTSLEALVAQTDNLRGEHLAIDRDELVVSTAAIRFCDLKVVHISRKSALTGDIQEFRSFFFMVWLFCSAAAALLAFGLSHFLTRDIKTLGDIIAQINRRSYQTKVVFPRSDEISVLGCLLYTSRCV